MLWSSLGSGHERRLIQVTQNQKHTNRFGYLAREFQPYPPKPPFPGSNRAVIAGNGPVGRSLPRHCAPLVSGDGKWIGGPPDHKLGKPLGSIAAMRHHQSRVRSVLL